MLCVCGTYEECHCECVEDDYEEEFEKVGCGWCEACHPVCSIARVSGSFWCEKKGGTHIVATMIEGTIRNGTTSNMNRERSHAVGLRADGSG